jgi:hypothetical protein
VGRKFLLEDLGGDAQALHDLGMRCGDIRGLAGIGGGVVERTGARLPFQKELSVALADCGPAHDDAFVRRRLAHRSAWRA